MKELKSEWPALLALLVALAAAALAWPHSPDTLPVHWGVTGQPDRFGGKFEGLLMVPLAMLGVFALLLALQRWVPGEARNAPVYRAARLGVALLAAALTLARVLDWPMARSSLVASGLVVMLVGNVLGKARPSPFVGLRTPWVFASRRAWYASQRRGAVWLTGYGLLLALCGAALPREWLFPWAVPFGMLAALLGMLGWLILASYRDWRADPDPQAALRPEPPHSDSGGTGISSR